jgi:glycolate oxidase FAD binding subunit
MSSRVTKIRSVSAEKGKPGMSNSDQVVSALKGIVGEANVISNPDQLKAYAVDGLIPKAVVSPGSAEEISKVVVYANTEKLAVVPRGNGTKMAAGGVPKKVDIVLSLLRLNRVLEYDVANMSLSIEAGITLAEVQKKLGNGGKGNFLALDPPQSEKATVGGIIATNASGPRRYLYGTSRDMLLGVKVVSPEGAITAFGGKVLKNVSGYDMTKLMIGTWGSLGIITQITAKLLPLPEVSSTLLVSLEDLAAANAIIRKVMHSVLLPSAIELISGKAAERLGEKSKYLLAFSLEGVAEAVERQSTEIADLSNREGAISTKILKGADDQKFWIRLRNFSEDMAKEFSTPIVLKSNFLISKHTELLGTYEKLAQAAGINASFVLHAGNGILYTYIFEKADRSGIVELIGKLTAEAVKCEGNLMVDSGPREIKEKISAWGQLRDDQVVMRRLKEKLDPKGVLNPGRFVGGI